MGIYLICRRSIDKAKSPKGRLDAAHLQKGLTKNESQEDCIDSDWDYGIHLLHRFCDG